MDKLARTFTLYEVYALIEYLGVDAARLLAAKAGEPIKDGNLTLGQDEALRNRLLASMPKGERTNAIERILSDQVRINLETISVTEVVIDKDKAVIDTDNNPRLPFSGATIKKHARQGKILIEKRVDGLYIDGQKVVLYRSVRQITGQPIVGHELRKELDGQPVLSASVLDFLLANPEYIPEEWKEKDEKGNIVFIYFWGTIFRNSVGSLYVRSLYWVDDRCGEGCRRLGSGFGGRSPAAVLASISA